jgi:hypothetical protein
VLAQDLGGLLREALAEGVFVDDAEGLVDGLEDRGRDPSALSALDGRKERAYGSNTSQPPRLTPRILSAPHSKDKAPLLAWSVKDLACSLAHMCTLAIAREARRNECNRPIVKEC